MEVIFPELQGLNAEVSELDGIINSEEPNLDGIISSGELDGIINSEEPNLDGMIDSEVLLSHANVITDNCGEFNLERLLKSETPDAPSPVQNNELDNPVSPRQVVWLPKYSLDLKFTNGHFQPKGW